MTTSTTSPLRVRLREATAQLTAAAIASPRHDGERLAAHALGVRWSGLWASADAPIDERADERLAELVRRRCGGEPLAYILGTVVFYGLELECGPGVLVPRPETETLVDVALELIDSKDDPVVVDLGCGSGAIALAIATHRDDAIVVGTDISEAALAYARRNVSRLDEQVRLLGGDLFDALDRELRGAVDLVVSNPPYVPSGTPLPADVRAEPACALFAGPRGDEILARIVSEAPAWLRTGGALAVEIGETGQAAVLPGAELRADLTGRPRVAWARF
jgi:release factor glutamine methyltransferase